MKKLNAAGEKEIIVHMKTVRKARAALKKQAGELKKNIGKDITFALTQDAKINRDMKRADKTRPVKKKR